MAADKSELGRATLLGLLGPAGARPVDEVIETLTYREIGVRPAHDLATVIARPDEFKDRLLAELALSPAAVDARGKAAPDARHAYYLHTFALYLAGLWADARAFQPIVAYLAADPVAADQQLDILLTEDVPAILARTYDGSDLGPLKAIIESTHAPPFLRGACFRALHAMARLGKISHDEVVAYVEALARSLDLEANMDFLDVFALDAAGLQDARLRPVIDRWFAEKRIDAGLLQPADIDAAYATPYETLNEELTRRERFGELVDYVSDWAWFNASDPEDFGAPEEAPVGQTIDEMLDYEASQPFVRGGRKIGRNEPCPCGSGRKYKKCCLVDDGA